MTHLNKIKSVILSFIALTLLGCGSDDKLSRVKAEKLIKEKYNLPFDEINVFNLYSGERTDAGGGNEISNHFGQLSDEGLLTYTSRYVDSYAPYYEHIGELTEKGKLYSIDDSIMYSQEVRIPSLAYRFAYINVKTSKVEFGEITGVVQDKQSNTATVTYTKIRKDVTPFGKIAFKLKEGPFNSIATFTKYDDGWRVN